MVTSNLFKLRDLQIHRRFTMQLKCYITYLKRIPSNDAQAGTTLTLFSVYLKTGNPALLNAMGQQGINFIICFLITKSRKWPLLLYAFQ